MSDDDGDGASGQPVRATGSTEARPSHQSAPRPSAVLLDFHNTLAVVRSVDEWIDEASDLVAGGPAPGTIPRERIRNVWGDARRLFPTLDWDLDPTAHRHAFVSTLSHDDAIPIDVADALYAVMPNQWMLNAGASDFIARASAVGTRLGIVSNIALDIRPALGRWGIADAIDAVILSYEVGCVKPDPRIFRLAADALGVDPADCLMIGDSAHDDVGGAALGMPCLIVPPDGTWRAFALASP
ncbi:HAD family hydrolase [Plantibacter sp. VKM Ac-2885]|uniref:HAD family hydrolase n=1 Tax=Plantibacter sp. VKM Ac-2885 TaxID=2783828 RepID=UPI00188A4883|nr:HAD family hydrolase [Plantibacter sp. VKM Ac-2885]MBF4513000.1 HAD family hydrolase [Plantibacter sp. VKM Ac-2885]